MKSELIDVIGAAGRSSKVKPISKGLKSDSNIALGCQIRQIEEKQGRRQSWISRF